MNKTLLSDVEREKLLKIFGQIYQAKTLDLLINNTNDDAKIIDETAIETVHFYNNKIEDVDFPIEVGKLTAKDKILAHELSLYVKQEYNGFVDVKTGNKRLKAIKKSNNANI